MAARKKQPPAAPPAEPTGQAALPPASPQAGAPQAGAPLGGSPADSGLSIDRLAQAFAAMMGGGPATAGPAAHTPPPRDVVHVDASPDLDAMALLDADGSSDDESTVRVSPLSIFEALLFVGRPDRKPLTSRMVAGLMRGVRPEEVADLAAELSRRYRADNSPYDVVAREDGWLLRLRPEFLQFGSVLEQRTRTVRLDAEALDVLAVVAWSQPVPRDKLVELGCDARPAVLRQLVRRGLLELRHSSAGADAPPTYHTTGKFLEVFRLERIEDLPDPTGPPT
jgi:segregation and condensation protein B